MKKTLLLSALLISLISIFRPQRAEAQITGATITGYNGFLSSTCVLPNMDSIGVYGTLAGSVATGDSVTIYINFDDGSDTTFRLADYSYGGTSGGGFNAYINHTYTTPGTFTAYYLVTTSSATTGSYTSPAFTLSDSCSTLTGTCYVDANSNCVHDAGELYIPWVPVILVNTSTSDTTWGGWTDDSGHYAIQVYPGNYTIIADPNIYSWWWWYGWSHGDSNLHPTCPSSGYVTLTVGGSTTYSNDFAYACTPPTAFDVSVGGWNWCYTPGDTTYEEVWVGNWWWYWDFTCSSLSTTITLSLDSRLTYAGTPSWATAPSSVSGGTLTWNYTGSTEYFGFWTIVQVVTSSTATIGDTICNTVYASPTSLTDPDLTNNTESFCGVVRSSYDPNGKSVSPQGEGTQGFINNNTPLSYEIHFQNTGTAAARNITVVDTLSPNVDPHTLHLLKSSFPCTMYTEGNLVKFSFNGINLPDSAGNPTGSIGSIVYGVMPKPGLAPGTQIKNKAGIFFDYNPAVWTNGTLNTIYYSTAASHLTNASFKATVYPNPAGNVVSAVTEDKSEFTMTLTDMLGRTQATGKSTKGTATLSTQALPTGLYIVKLVNAAGKELTTKLTVQH